MIPQEIIRKKRDNQALSFEELNNFFMGYIDGSVSDYQASAMLMAIFLRGMNPVETANLTKIARDSGKVFSWPHAKGRTFDKHSTGGIGDKTSIVILPLCLLEGLNIPMMAGRGLGHTGGTLDKLEAIPGMTVFLPEDKIAKQMQTLGGVFMGQTEQVAALDRKLYALRDVTSTVESIPLIVASILSKKLAEGLDGLVMDVKFGSGAFMSEYQQAKHLAQSLIDVGKECNLKMKAMLTDMDSPLGYYAGNSLEIYECLEIMRGTGPQDTIDLTIALTAEMVHMHKRHESIEVISKRLVSYLKNGTAYEMFCKIIASQGGDIKFFDKKENFFQAKIVKPVMATTSGKFIQKINTRELGMAVIVLGGGRTKVTDKINPNVGISGLKRVGDAIAPDEPIAWIHGDDQASVDHASKMIQTSIQLGDNAEKKSLVAEILTTK